MSIHSGTSSGEQAPDLLVIGAGIVGLAIARVARAAGASVLVVDRHWWPGREASGRNSGVLHAGLYYGTDTLKARLCRRGNHLLRDWMLARGVPFRATGKLVAATREEELPRLEALFRNALDNGADVELLTDSGLRDIAPGLRAPAAIWSPQTAVFDPTNVLRALKGELEAAGVRFRFGVEVRHLSRDGPACRTAAGERLTAGRIVNAAGMLADRLAHQQGIGTHYRILPFRGSYRRLAPRLRPRVPTCIYPVPDPNLPFLGVHLTPTVYGEVLAGPSATPALGRFHYGGGEGISPTGTAAIGSALLGLVFRNDAGLRRHVRHELARRSNAVLAEEIARWLPGVTAADIRPWPRPGLRAQLFDTRERKLVNDFIVLEGSGVLHILNAVSPAFTSSFAMAEYLAPRCLPGNDTDST